MDRAWDAIFEHFDIINHDFNAKPFFITTNNIKEVTRHFKKTTEKEVRILCYQDRREKRPKIFKDNNLFLLPIKNGEYAILKGEGYIDIPTILTTTNIYNTKLTFDLDTSNVGNSEMQHIDYAYATSLIRTFLDDDSLVLTIRGRKFTPEFSFFVGKHEVSVSGVQTEVDAGYEGKNQVVLIEGKRTGTQNIIIRQLFYPFKQWKNFTKKHVKTLFFEKNGNTYSFWLFSFKDHNDYNSIYLLKSESFIIE
jgi:hypothetical protein